jgi:hypothetical protein
LGQSGRGPLHGVAQLLEQFAHVGGMKLLSEFLRNDLSHQNGINGLVHIPFFQTKFGAWCRTGLIPVYHHCRTPDCVNPCLLRFSIRPIPSDSFAVLKSLQ